uniref:Uncharacterized protein n=2 Tax=Chenopodium quinoa TaxID=63459 RepID=A0A803MBU3_CHEQI
MKKKRLQLQARKASINFYLQPYQQKNNNSSSGALWYFDPKSYYHAPAENHNFSLYEESQISFGQFDYQHEHEHDHQKPRAAAFQQFTVTHGGSRCTSENSTPVIVKPVTKQSCQSLDLQLGLSTV